MKSRDAKELESELYDEPHGKSILRRGATFFKNIAIGDLSKPSTHGGYYFAGAGWRLGLSIGLLWEIPSMIYSNGPEIISGFSRGAYGEAFYHVWESIVKVGLNAAYVSFAFSTVGYESGSIITGKFANFAGYLVKRVFGLKGRER